MAFKLVLTRVGPLYQRTVKSRTLHAIHGRHGDTGKEQKETAQTQKQAADTLKKAFENTTKSLNATYKNIIGQTSLADSFT